MTTRTSKYQGRLILVIQLSETILNVAIQIKIETIRFKQKNHYINLLAEETTDMLGMAIDGVESPGKTESENCTNEEDGDCEGLIPR